MKRKKIPKKLREKIHFKYLGRCAYCGESLKYKDMQIDHVDPVYLFGDNINVDNLKSTCRSCNRYKSTFTLDKFKNQLYKIPSRLERDSTTYRIAKKYALIKENKTQIKFYFEQLQENVDKLKDKDYSVWDCNDKKWFIEMCPDYYQNNLIEWLKEFKNTKF